MAAVVRRQIEEIKTLPDRSLAYASLLQLQRRSADEPSSMEALSLCSPPLLPLLLSDAHRHDEEIAAQALKCLGFMLYHPSLVPIISEKDASLVLDSLTELITTTRMKAVCNLGVWCISIQQLSAKFLEDHIRSLLRAMVHALDNPFGSLSTTFEGIQAVMKLAAQLCGTMRQLSNIWVPPIYRRLISSDKKERDMAERCILKAKSIIFPPPSTLSEIVEKDLIQTLLPRMMDILHDHLQKVHLIQAWGWYVCLLGPNALKKRHLVNKLLKIPEQTFTDHDPQVQIASLVAWENLVDSLIEPQVIDAETKLAQTEPASSMTSMIHCDNQVASLLRRIKVIMIPLQGLLSSKCDISVRSSCLNTWHYLLHKLGLSINHPSVIMNSFTPILEVIFSRGPDNINICLWNSCIELLDEFVLSKVKIGEMDMIARNSLCLVNEAFATGSHANGKSSWKHYPVKWLPWEINNLNFHLKMISSVVGQELLMTLTPENRTLTCNAASRIFRSVLQGVQVELKIPSTHYDKIQFCINSIFKFAREMCEDMVSKQATNRCTDLIWMALQFVKAIREEIEPSILASPLFRIHLDFIYINMQSAENIKSPKVQGLGVLSLSVMEMVSPMVYTTILHLCVVAQSILYLADIDALTRAIQHSKILFFSMNPSINLHAIICFLYMHIGKPVHQMLYWLTVWRVIAKDLKETIDSVDELVFLKTEYDDSCYSLIHWFLCFPLLMLFSPGKVCAPSSSGSSSQLSLVSWQRTLELELVVEVWKSLFYSSSHASLSVTSSMNSFTEGLCKVFIRVLDENSATLQGNIEFCLNGKSHGIMNLFIFGEAAIHILKDIQVLVVTTLESIEKNQESSNDEQCSLIKHALGLVARFLGLSLPCVESNPQADHVVISRVFAAMACLVGRICLKQDIVLLMEIISDPIVRWLSVSASIYGEIQQGSIIHQLQDFWAQTLECLQRSQPPIDFDSFFLGVQAPLLRTALDHPYLPISNASIAFWKATYGQKANLSYPQCLLPVLNKLTRSGRISLQKESPVVLLDNGSSIREVIGVSGRYTASKTDKICGPVAMQELECDSGCIDIVNMGLRRKRLKMVKNPVKANKSHQPRFGRIHGFGPKVDADFSQVFKHPKDQEVRKPKHVLEMLRRSN